MSVRRPMARVENAENDFWLGNSTFQILLSKCGMALVFQQKIFQISFRTPGGAISGL